MICSLATRLNRLCVQKLPSGTIILLTNAPRLENRPSGVISPNRVSLSLLQPGNSKLRSNHEAESRVRSGRTGRVTFENGFIRGVQSDNLRTERE
jgi:hypothetical protein